MITQLTIIAFCIYLTIQGFKVVFAHSEYAMGSTAAAADLFLCCLSNFFLYHPDLRYRRFSERGLWTGWHRSIRGIQMFPIVFSVFFVCLAVGVPHSVCPLFFLIYHAALDENPRYDHGAKSHRRHRKIPCLFIPFFILAGSLMSPRELPIAWSVTLNILVGRFRGALGLCKRCSQHVF